MHTYRDNSHSKTNILVSLFFTISAFEGVIFLAGMLRLPQSEAGSAILFGFSPLRLGILLLHTAGVLLFAILAVRCWISPAFARNVDARLRTVFRNHDLTASAVFTLLVVWCFGVVALEILLNPALFPKAILYRFLYDRIRWPLLWSLLVGMQAALLMTANRWFPLTRPGQPNELKQSQRSTALGGSMLVVSLLMAAGMWAYYNRIPTPHTFASPGVNAALLGGMILLYLGLHFITRQQAHPGQPDQPRPEQRPFANRQGTWLETAVWILVLVSMAGMYLYTRTSSAPLANPNFINDAPLHQVIFGFGFHQLRLTPLWVIGIWSIALAGGLWLLRMYPLALQNQLDRIHAAVERKPVWLWVAALLFFLTCWLLRSNMQNRDIQIITGWLPAAFESDFIHVRLDEMWETNLHASFYMIAHTILGWDVLTSYQFLSCLTAPFFFVLLYRLARRLVPSKAVILVLLLLSGGYVQLFFGDAENYTFTALLVLIYFYTAYCYLQGEVAFPVPAMILALSMSFHFETIFLVPTLLFLSIHEVHRRAWFTLASGWLGVAAHLALTLLFFGFNGASLVRMRDTSWGLGRSGNLLANFSAFEIHNFFARLNLFALIFPLIYFVLLLLLFRRIHASGFNGFLLVGSLSGAAFALTWKSAIGLYSDWNLFSIPLLPVIFLLCYNLVRNLQIPLKRELVFSMIALAGLVSCAWILQNHWIAA